MFQRVADGAFYRNALESTGRYLKGHNRGRRLLHRMGLTRYSPVRTAVGAASLFVIGGIVGAGLALLFTPRTGPQLRGEVKERAKGLMGRLSSGPPSAEEIAEAQAHA